MEPTICCNGSRWPRRLDQLAEAVNLRRREHALKLQIQPHPRLLEQVRQQQLRLQAGRIHPFLGQELRAALNGFQDRHAGKATSLGAAFKA